MYVVVNFYFQLNFSLPLFLSMLMYGNVHKNKGKPKKNLTTTIYTQYRTYLYVFKDVFKDVRAKTFLR